MLRAFLAGLALLLVTCPALAKKPFTNASLTGDYFFILSQVRTEFVGGVATTNYCDSAGTITFDGAGGATVTEVRRCSVTGTVTETNTLFYTVNADGSFLIDEVAGFTDPEHGQILAGGASLLIDGTTRTNPNVHIFHAVAMRR